MTTPDTAAVRSWAKENGYDVAGRGRLPAEVTDAYRAAQGTTKARKAPAKKAPARKAPAKRSAAKKAPAKRTTATRAVAKAPARAPETVATKQAPDTAGAPQAKPSPVADDRRLVALGEEIAALVRRVEALEKASGGKPGAPGKGSRFRRRS